MAYRTKSQIGNDITTTLPDNTSGAITPAIVRSRLQDIVDSTPDISSEISDTPTLTALSLNSNYVNPGDAGDTYYYKYTGITTINRDSTPTIAKEGDYAIVTDSVTGNIYLVRIIKLGSTLTPIRTPLTFN